MMQNLASSLEKFIPTTLISVNTLLGLSPHHWTESNHLEFYLLSSLTPSAFQFLILDDLDLLSKMTVLRHKHENKSHAIHT